MCPPAAGTLLKGCCQDFVSDPGSMEKPRYFAHRSTAMSRDLGHHSRISLCTLHKLVVGHAGMNTVSLPLRSRDKINAYDSTFCSTVAWLLCSRSPPHQYHPQMHTDNHQHTMSPLMFEAANPSMLRMGDIGQPCLILLRTIMLVAS